MSAPAVKLESPTSGSIAAPPDAVIVHAGESRQQQRPQDSQNQFDRRLAPATPHQQHDNIHMDEESRPVLKRRRITKACDFCHRRGRKCKIPSGPSPGNATAVTCLTCIEHGAACTWDRVAAKRGVKSKGTKALSQEEPSPTFIPVASSASASAPAAADRATVADEEAWVYDETRHGGRQMVRTLIRIFFNTVYPIFPFFAETPFLQEWDQSSLSSSRPAFARLMAVCALSSCHVRDGAVFTPGLSVPVESSRLKAYLEDAKAATPSDISAADCFDYLRTMGTLSLAAIQLGDASLMHQTLGMYHSVTAQHNFQNESRWPANLDPGERHVRRQFFWSMYRLEVHSALITGHSIRCPEMQAVVSYPVMSCDSAGALAGSRHSTGGFAWGGWLVGWNYITDLYRVLEHVIVRSRAGKVAAIDRGTLYGAGTTTIVPSVDDILARVLGQRVALPDYLASAPPPSADIESNLCGFQVANIACTIQLLRMTSFSGQGLFKDACLAATELIDEMSRTPVDYLRAIGSPMLQELAGVGHMLTSFIGRHLHPAEYHQLREVIQAMAVFLKNLGPALPCAVEAGGKLSQHIGRIDQYLERTQPQDSSILNEPLNEPEHPQTAHDPRPQVPIQHFVVPHANYTIPMEYLEHIPWPSPFGVPEETGWSNSLNLFGSG